MPPKRRSSAAPKTTQANQPKLAFHGVTNKVTKAATTTRSAKSHQKIDDILAASSKSAPETAGLEPEVAQAEATTTSEEAIIQQTAAEVAAPAKSASQLDAENEARKIPEAQIKKYWAAKEKARKAPRVHQEGLPLHEKVLREWDMCGQYGPAIGIARLKRWNRANRLNLNPPIEVLAVLLMEQDRNNATAQRAYVDELMSSHFVVEEA